MSSTPRRKRPPTTGTRRPSPTRNRKPVSKRKGPKHRNIPVAVIAGIIFVIVIAYLLNAGLSLGSNAEIPSVAVQMGNMDVPVMLNGIIIRSEQVYSAPMSGMVSFNYNDQDRVRKGATVCSIYNEQAVEDLATDIDELNKAILRLQDRRSEISAFTKDVNNINTQIKTMIDNKALISLQSSFGTVTEIKETITQNLNLRNQILLNESRGSLSTLASDKQHYESELNKNFTNVYAESSGVIAYVVDGLEGALNFERLGNITPEETRQTVDYDRLMRDRSVEKDAPVFKMLNSNEWYIAAYIPMEMVFDWVEGETRTIYIQKSGDLVGVEMQIDRLTQGEIEYYVLFKSTKNVLDFINMRNVTFKISNSEHKGYKIPTQAIIDQTLLKIPAEYVVEEDGHYVIRHTEALDERISVTVHAEEDGYYVVSQEINRLVLHDSLKLPEEPYTILTLSEVVNVKGVYVINRGYAEFKRITIDPGMPVNGDYVIIDPADNKDIRIYDRIISDAKTITAQQKVVK